MLELNGLSKKFGRHTVLADVSLTIRPGEIHGIVGLNGSGKSTLLNILAGTPVIGETGGYTGEIRLNGQPVFLKSPSDAFQAGIGMVHQEFSLFYDMTVAENIRLGREKVIPVSQRLAGRDFALPDSKKNIAEVQSLLREMGLSLQPDERVGGLPVSRKQFAEIAREIDKPALSLLLLDEPTSTLNRQDTERLIALVKNLSAKGVSVIYVSHSLREVTGLCNRITVMQNGGICAGYDAGAFDTDRITHDMVGGSVVKVFRKRRKRESYILLSLKQLSAKGQGERLAGIDLDIRKGEILGVAGISGHGKSALGPAVLGLCPVSGEIRFNGAPVGKNVPDAMVGIGLALLTDDRKSSLLHGHSVMENIVFSALLKNGRFLRRGFAGRLGFTDRRKMEAYAEKMVERCHIHCRSIHQKAGELSGGNQQKLCFARILSSDPKIIFAGEPTRGIDLNAREVILDLLLRENLEKGTTLVLSSEDLEELKRICDRIAIVYRGEIVDILGPESDDVEFARAFSGERVGR